MPEVSEKATHGGARQGAGRRKLEDPRIRKTVFLHQSEWELLKSKCQDGETISQALCRILGQAVSQNQYNANVIEFKKRHKPKTVAQIKSIQGDVTDLDQRHMDYIVENLSRIFFCIRDTMEQCAKNNDANSITFYQGALAIEMILEALDSRVFTDRIKHLKAPKSLQAEAEAIESSLIGG